MEDESEAKGVHLHGGRRRKSKLIDLQGLSDIQIRERVTRKLQVHDFDKNVDAITKFSEDEYKIIRLIAQEGVVSGNEAAIRYKAIMALANFSSVQNFNILADLARFGEDFYIRGHAMLALGKTSLYAHLPILIAGLKSKEQFERVAASRAIITIIVQTSAAGAKAHVAAIGDTEILENFEKILEQIQLGDDRPSEPQETETTPKQKGG